MAHFNKDKWIRYALARRYLVVDEDGTIHRAVKADERGVPDASKGWSVVKVQVHKKSGRVYFNMTYMGFTKSILVNRVVAWAFYPNPTNLPQVNHIDGDKENNAKSNLEWSSGSDNEKHAHRTGLKTGRGSANSNAKLTAADVVAIRASADPVRAANPDLVPGLIRALAEQYGVSRSTVVNILKRSTWSHV